MRNQAHLIAYVDRLGGGTFRDLEALLGGALAGAFAGVHLLPFFHPIDGADAGFDPRIGYSSDDMVVMQAWVAAGLGVATQTGLALLAHHIEGVVATELPGSKRHIYAATYGEPPDPFGDG